MTISNSTVRRLSIYLRQLELLRDEGNETVASSRLAEMSAVKATQLRKDLSYFGSFGVRGMGYSVAELASKIKNILGLDREWRAVLFGAGSLGQALAGYRGFGAHNIRIVAVVDSDPAKSGRKIAGLSVESTDVDYSTLRHRTRASIGVIAVPAEFAQTLAGRIVEAGFAGIVNFAPVRLKLPSSIALYSVDLAMAFENVTYRLALERR